MAAVSLPRMEQASSNRKKTLRKDKEQVTRLLQDDLKMKGASDCEGFGFRYVHANIHVLFDHC